MAKQRRIGIYGLILLACVLFAGRTDAHELIWNDEAPLTMPRVGTHGLRVLSPRLLELILVNSKAPDPARVTQWDFVSENFQLKLPAPDAFRVLVNGSPVPVQTVGFKRRPLYAPLRQRDLRIGNYLYLELGGSIADGQQVEVQNPPGDLWLPEMQFVAQADALRQSPAIHVNQVGYMPGLSKKGMVGYYLGSLGEMPIPATAGYQLIEEATGRVVYEGSLVRRPDQGYSYSPRPYQQVYEADFSEFQLPGEYRLLVPGLGASYPFLIDAGTAPAFARTYAMGLYHQRCGAANELPFTRFIHDPCHTAPADMPTMQFHKTQQFLAESSSDFSREPRHTAPQLKDVDSSLYPFVNRNQVDVSGGHHDAGDYSKYTINSAGLIHYLVFAADSFSNAGVLDNLGLPESGDGKSDLLQEVKWEAEFLAKMQDADGGFYFLVYPRDRRYEDNVLPEFGDPQVVWPKTTAVTAAAVAALAETASSPLFREQFPAEAARYLEKAKAGWQFLEQAIARHGKDGAYQKITHYGHEFLHDDELAWAAAALYAATGESKYHDKLRAWFDPSDARTRRWGWWRLFEGYGCAVRTYAFAATSGRLAAQQLDAAFLAKCEAEIRASAQDHLRFARENAYGTSFPGPNKEYKSAGWFFSMERAFDLAVAYQLEERAEILEALLSNLNYEGGCNPVSVTYVTGLGARRQREIVHHYAQNDLRVLPPTGLPLGNIQAGFSWHYHYKQELSALNFPADGATTAPYPFYDRWGDTFNTTTEFVVVDQARSLASAAFLMARSELKSQTWRAASPQIAGVPDSVAAEEPQTATLTAPGIDLARARIVWEARDQEPHLGHSFTFTPRNPGEQWIEVEAQLPDGRRLNASRRFVATASSGAPPNGYQSAPVDPSGDVITLFHLDNDRADASGRAGALRLIGNAALDSSNVSWMANRAGSALAVRDLGEKAVLAIPSRIFAPATGTSSISLEAMLYVNSFKGYNRGNVRLLCLYDNWNAYLGLAEDAYSGPQVKGGTQFSFGGGALTDVITPRQWHHIRMTIDRSRYTLKVDGTIVAGAPATELENWGRSNVTMLEFGNFDGWIDEVVVKKTTGGAATAPLGPIVVLTSPENAGTFAPSKEISISAAAYSDTGRLAKVEFFNGTTKIAEIEDDAYAFTWINPPIGQHVITARVTDRSGRTATSDAARVTVAAPVAIVSTPVITPSGGIFPRPIPVMLSSATPGASIRYTVDGQNPDRQSPVYGAPITIASTATVKAKAFKDGMSESGLASATVVIDSTLTTAQSTFVGGDRSTRGAWQGAYGSHAYQVIGNGVNLPAQISVLPSGHTEFVWAASTTDSRALEKVSGSNRIASCWYAERSFTLDINFKDGQAHRLSLYFMDWDRQNRKQSIEIIDAARQQVLDTRIISGFGDGQYLRWDVQGRVRVRITNLAGPNAVLMGLFVDSGVATGQPGAREGLPALHRLGNGDLQIQWSGQIGQSYRLEASVDLMNWLPISTNVPGEQRISITDPAARSFPARFYRVIASP